MADALGGDFDKPYEEIAAREEAEIEQHRRIIVTCDGPSITDVKITTSDGVDLGQYGVVAAVWEVDAERGHTSLTLVFFDAAIRIDHPVVLATIADTRCTCKFHHWAEYVGHIHDLDCHRNIELPCDDVYMLITTHGIHHDESCPRFTNDQEPERSDDGV